ncbi:nucleoside phosphorylase-I family protein, partial [Maribellus maritimus]
TPSFELAHSRYQNYFLKINNQNKLHFNRGILANELEIPYATIALSTDYDCWKTDEAPVTWEEVLKVFNQNVKNVISLITKTISSFQPL